MTYEQKRKIIRIAVAVTRVMAMVVTAVLWLINRTTYTDFRTHQFQRLDLELLGETPGGANGLYTTATWVGEGYTCTVEHNGKTGECISIPFVNWEMSDVWADGNGGHAEVWFQVAERTVLDGEVCTGTSPYRYSNVTLTIIFGDRTGYGDCWTEGRVFQGRSTVLIQDVENLEVSLLHDAMGLTPDEVEIKTEKTWDQLKTFATLDRGAQVIRLRLPEQRRGRSKGSYLSGQNPMVRIWFGIECRPDVDRHGTDRQKIPQTAYFKVTYDVENTITGERTTNSTGWISQNYTAYGLRYGKFG